MNPNNDNDEQKPATYNDVTPPSYDEQKVEPQSLEQAEEPHKEVLQSEATDQTVTPFEPQSQQQTAEANPTGEQVQPVAAPMFANQSTPPAKLKNGNKKFVFVTVLLILLALSGTAGAYLWQNKQVQSLDEKNAALTTELAGTKANKSTSKAVEPATPTGTLARSQEQTDFRLVTGTVDLNAQNTRQADSIYVEPYMKHAGELEEIWLEYGDSPSALTEQTERQSNGIGTGDANTYSQWPFALKKSAFDSGKTYFYRVAAKNGSTIVYSGVAAFTNTK